MKTKEKLNFFISVKVFLPVQNSIIEDWNNLDSQTIYKDTTEVL